MFYDPMICKLVTYGATRDLALDKMRGALDAYVITGVGHNIPFLRDLTEHTRFMSGDISTQFIGEEYPGGFNGVVLSDPDRALAAAGTAVMHAIREEAYGVGVTTADVVFITLGATEGTAGEKGPNYAVKTIAKPSSASCGGVGRDWDVVVVDDASKTPRNIYLEDVTWAPCDPVLFAKVRGGTEKSGRASNGGLRLQAAARLPDGFNVVFKGATLAAHVRTSRQQELGSHMLPKVKTDFSKMLVSPMPGRLVSVAVVVGASVEIGQELAVVEAMKMANVLRSPRKGLVKAVRVKAGATLSVDEVIIDFE